MYPVIRLFSSGLRAFLSPAVSLQAVTEITFYCRPWDLDMFLEMNNGRVLTLYDLGRFDLAIRSGLVNVLREKRWGLVVAGSSVRYRRRVRLFNKVTIRTHIVGFDQRWIYINQSMWVKGLPASSVLLRTGVTEKGKTLPIKQVLEAVNLPDWELEPQGWVKEWIHSEQVREWPPV